MREEAEWVKMVEGEEGMAERSRERRAGLAEVRHTRSPSRIGVFPYLGEQTDIVLTSQSLSDYFEWWCRGQRTSRYDVAREAVRSVHCAIP